MVEILGNERNRKMGNKNNKRNCQTLNFLLLKNEAQARKKNGKAIKLSIVIGPIFSKMQSIYHRV